MLLQGIARNYELTCRTSFPSPTNTISSRYPHGRVVVPLNACNLSLHIDTSSPFRGSSFQIAPRILCHKNCHRQSISGRRRSADSGCDYQRKTFIGDASGLLQVLESQHMSVRNLHRCAFNVFVYR